MSGSKSYNRGRIGENIACEYLKNEGHHIIKRNFRAAGGEIDIISGLGGKIYFSEVKARKENALVAIEESITKAKKMRLKQAALSFISQNLTTQTEIGFLFIFIILKNDNIIKQIEVVADSL